MKIRLIILFSLLFSGIFISCNAQHQSEKKYIDMVIKGNRLFALTASGHLNIFNLNTGAAIDTNVHANTTIIAMNMDRKGNITVVKSNQTIDQFDEQKLSFKPLFTSTNQVYNIVFTQSGKGYLITSKGVIDLSTKKTFLPDSSFNLNHQLRGWGKPSTVFIDNDDNIWMGSGHGEWGGDLFVFNTKTGKFIKPVLNNFRIELYPVKSIFTDGASIYISCGLQHMMISGCIVKFTNFKCDTVFNSQDHMTQGAGMPPGWMHMAGGEYIGPATYNKADNYIYFYSQNGIFKGNKDKDLSQIKNWTKLVSPTLHWTNGQPDAVGSPVNVLKMQFAPNGKLYLVTQNDGIGLYDGKNFSLLTN